MLKSHSWPSISMRSGSKGSTKHRPFSQRFDDPWIWDPWIQRANCILKNTHKYVNQHSSNLCCSRVNRSSFLKGHNLVHTGLPSGPPKPTVFCHTEYFTASQLPWIQPSPLGPKAHHLSRADQWWPRLQAGFILDQSPRYLWTRETKQAICFQNTLRDLS